MNDPFDYMYQSFQLFGSNPSVVPIQMSAGVNWAPASDEAIKLLKLEMDSAVSYRNYGRSSGGKIVTDILASVEQKLAHANSKITAVVTNGTCDAAHIVTTTLLRKKKLQAGDSCLAIAHCFPYYFNLFNEAGLAYKECIDDTRLFPTMERVEQAIQQHRPKIVVLMLPHNPSGQILSGDDYCRIVNIAISAGAVVFLDRVCMMMWDYSPTLVSAFYDHIAEGNLFVFDSLGKSDSLAGLRTGYLLCGEEWQPCIEQTIRYRTLNPIVFSTLTLAFTRIATLAYTNGKESIICYERLIDRYLNKLFLDYPNSYELGFDAVDLFSRISNYIKEQLIKKERIETNFQATEACFTSQIVKPLILDGGFNVLLETNGMLTKNEREDQKKLCSSSGVAVLTEHCFRVSESTRKTYFLRIGLSLPEVEFTQGLEKLEAYYTHGI